MAGENESMLELPPLGCACSAFEAGDLIHFVYYDNYTDMVEERWGIVLGIGSLDGVDYWANSKIPRFNVLWFAQDVGNDRIVDYPWSSWFCHDSIQGKYSQIVARPSLPDRMNLRGCLE